MRVAQFIRAEHGLVQIDIVFLHDHHPDNKKQAGLLCGHEQFSFGVDHGVGGKQQIDSYQPVR